MFDDKIILRKDREWSIFDGELCLITNFLPMNGSIVKNDVAISPVITEPYASINIKCNKTDKEIVGYITHKIDFINMWHVFKEINLNEDAEEVLIYWTMKHYNNYFVKILSLLYFNLFGGTPFPKMFVMLFQKGTYKKSISRKDCGDSGVGRFGVSSNCRLPENKNAQVFIYSSMPVNCWIPEIMKERL